MKSFLLMIVVLLVPMYAMGGYPTPPVTPAMEECRTCKECPDCAYWAASAVSGIKIGYTLPRQADSNVVYDAAMDGVINTLGVLRTCRTYNEDHGLGYDAEISEISANIDIAAEDYDEGERLWEIAEIKFDTGRCWHIVGNAHIQNEDWVDAWKALFDAYHNLGDSGYTYERSVPYFDGAVMQLECCRDEAEWLYDNMVDEVENGCGGEEEMPEE